MWREGSGKEKEEEKGNCVVHIRELSIVDAGWWDLRWKRRRGGWVLIFLLRDWMWCVGRVHYSESVDIKELFAHFRKSCFGAGERVWLNGSINNLPFHLSHLLPSPGIVAAKWASNVYLTDYIASLLDNLVYNVSLNRGALSSDSSDMYGGFWNLFWLA